MRRLVGRLLEAACRALTFDVLRVDCDILAFLGSFAQTVDNIQIEQALNRLLDFID